MAKTLALIAFFGVILVANAVGLPSKRDSLKERLSEVLRNMLEEDTKETRQISNGREADEEENEERCGSCGGGGDNGLPDCQASDFSKCQFAAIQASLDAAAKTDIPIFIRCDMLAGLSNCDAEVLTTCNETPELTISDNVAEVHGRVHLLKGNCSCLDAPEEFPQCTDQCTALPCVNSGECVSDDAGTFQRCNCPDGYGGQFCQECTAGDCKSCKNWGECQCEEGVAGPFCQMQCSQMEEDLVPLYRDCIQIANDVYFLYPWPSICVFALVLDECVATTAAQCGKDVRETFRALDLEAGYDQAKYNLENAICKVGVDVPFPW